MKTALIKRGWEGFTVLELLVIVITVSILVVLVVPLNSHGGKQKATRINCVCNLKQVGLACRIWAADHNDLNPPQALTNQTGALLFADATHGYRYFQVMSNELSTPKILVCPADKRLAATNFTTDLNNSHLSYFVGLDADETKPNLFLSGDRNVTNGQAPLKGILDLQTNQDIGWTKEIHDENGNVGLADGSVQQLSSAKLKDMVAHASPAPNRLLLP